MVELSLMRLVHTWISRHKLRYIFSWISYALVSMVLVVIFSVGTSLQAGIANQLTINPLNYQLTVRNTRLQQHDAMITHDFSLADANRIMQETQAAEMRILYDTSYYIDMIDNKPVDYVKGKISFVDVNHVLLLKTDFEYWDYKTLGQGHLGFTGRLFTPASPIDSAIVTPAFMQAYKLSDDGVLNSTFSIKNQKGNIAKYTIVGVLQCAEQHPALSSSYIYLPMSQETDEQLRQDSRISSVTYSYHQDADMEANMDKISAGGYMCIRYADDGEYIKQMIKMITYIGTIVGLFILSLATIGLINTVLTTIQENAPFMRLFRIVGLKKAKYWFMMLYTVLLQGFIGGGIGCIISLLFQTQIYVFFTFLNLDTAMIIKNFSIQPITCFFIMLFCMGVSLLAILFALGEIQKKITLHDVH